MMRSAVVLLTLILAMGCMSNHTEHMVDIDPQGWSNDQLAEITFDNQDTLSEYRFSLLLRWDDLLNRVSVPCKIMSIAPDSTTFEEQVTFSIKNGVVSKFTTGYRNSQISYRTGVKLSQIGIYRFSIQHIVKEPMVGIWAIGFNISK